MELIVDKRLEILEAIIIAYKLAYGPFSEDGFDWVEINDSKYLHDLVDRINIKRYPEINKFLESIVDCGCYTNLFVYFDDDMNYTDEYEYKVFESGTNVQFAELVREIYQDENLSDYFDSQEEEFKKIKLSLRSDLHWDLNRMEKFYGVDGYSYSIVISSLINGGFSSPRGKDLTYVRGIYYRGQKYETDQQYFIVCLYHEFSHAFVNPLVEKYKNKFENVEELYQESISYGLPSTYQKVDTLLCESFVRANALYLAEPFVSKEEIEDDLDWEMKRGFPRTLEIIGLIKENRDKYEKYEDLFINVIIPYINKICKELSIKKPHFVG